MLSVSFELMDSRFPAEADEIVCPTTASACEQNGILLIHMEQPTKTGSVESRAAKVLREIFESGRPLTYVRSSEEQRVGRVLREVALRLPAPAPVRVWTWSLTQGMHRDDEAAEAGTHAPLAALDFIAAHTEAAIFHLKDFHEPLRESAEVRRRLRDLYESCRDQRKFVVITSPVRSIPEEVERSLMFLELRPPDLVELVEFLRDETGGSESDTGEEILYQLASALQGLTLDEARYALRRALAVNPRLGPESLPAGLEENGYWSTAAAPWSMLPTVPASVRS